MNELILSKIKAALKDNVLEVCRQLLPGGKVNGREYICADVAGGRGKSMSVCLVGDKAGVWSDFAAGQSGGDLLDLYREQRGCGFMEAFQWAQAFTGIRDASFGGGTLQKAVKTSYGYVAPKLPQNVREVRDLLPWFNERRISENTLRAYGVKEMDSDHGPMAVFPYYDQKDKAKINFIKFRQGPNKKVMWTSKSSMPCLFGWQAINEDTFNQRTVIITEGEMDALAFYEAGYPALSIPQGAATDGKSRQEWIENEFDNLSMFETIILAFDMDEPGQATASYAATRLGNDRCVSVDFRPSKDANEVLMTGGRERLLEKIEPERLKLNVPDELVSPIDFLAELQAEAKDPTIAEAMAGEKLPWPSTVGKFQIREGETTVWFGVNGHGKSTLLNEVMVNSMRHGTRWVAASFEYIPKRFVYNASRTALGELLDGSDVTRGLLEKFWDNGLLFVPKNSVNVDGMIDAFSYAARRFGASNFIVDSLAKLGFAEDDYNGQKSVVDRLSEFARTMKVHVHLVCHSRKTQSEEVCPGKLDLKGTGAIADLVDNVCVVWRNKPKDAALAAEDPGADSMVDTVVRVVKQRFTGWEGAFQFFFDPISTQFSEMQGRAPRRYALEFARENGNEA